MARSVPRGPGGKGIARLPERVLRVREDKDGYLRFNTTVAGTHTTPLVHRLVARAFHGRPLERTHVIDHRDRNRQNNAADNLRYVTPLENSHNSASFVRTPERVAAFARECERMGCAQKAAKNLGIPETTARRLLQDAGKLLQTGRSDFIDTPCFERAA